MGERNKNILIVEDSPDLQDLLGQLFSSEGYTLFQAYNGQQALDILHEMPQLPALILLDIMMPVMDGIEFREKQSKDAKLANIPVVVMSADSNSQAKALQLSANGVVRKPIKDIEQLLKLAERFSS